MKIIVTCDNVEKHKYEDSVDMVDITHELLAPGEVLHKDDSGLPMHQCPECGSRVFVYVKV